jgi:4-aminobutyrate aminotransferase/(S)-3-amino-2-methylpropionate transaminase
MVGVEFVQDRESKIPNGDYLSALVGEAIRRGVVPVSCGPYHNVLRHLLPLVITDEQLDEGLDVLGEAARAARGERAGTAEPS